jgi:hypothetical protein
LAGSVILLIIMSYGSRDSPAYAFRRCPLMPQFGLFLAIAMIGAVLFGAALARFGRTIGSMT